MSRLCLIALAALLTGAIAGGSALAQSASTAGNTTPEHRAALANKFNRKLPACNALAKKQNVRFSEHRAFIRKCLRD